MKKYTVKNGKRVSQIVAQAAGELVETLSAKTRSVSAEDFLVAAKNHKLLKDQFTWDNTEAANQYRLSQARGLMNCFTVLVTFERRQIEVPGARYVDSEGGYVPSSLIYMRSERDLLDEVIASALRDARSFLVSYGQLRGVNGVGGVIRAIEEWADLESKKELAKIKK